MIRTLLNAQEVSYTSSLSQERLHGRLTALFGQADSSVAGRMLSENAFTAYDKLDVIGWNMPNLKRRSAYLKGIITSGKEGTSVNLSVSPNAVLPLFAILATLGGLVIAIMALSGSGLDGSYAVFGFSLIALGLVYYPASTFLRNRLRNRVMKHLDLVRA